MPNMNKLVILLSRGYLTFVASMLVTTIAYAQADEVQISAANFASVSTKGTAVASIVDKGRAKFSPCSACHGVQAEGVGSYPKLAGQRPEYLHQQLVNFKKGVRKSAVMRAMTINLSDMDIKALAIYLGSLE